MKLLLVHRSFPGQFRWMIPILVRQGLDVKFICFEKTSWPTNGIEVIEAEKECGENEVEEACKISASNLKSSGWNPDFILSHQGWGVWKVGGIFKNAKTILYCEWWYSKETFKYFSALERVNAGLRQRLGELDHGRHVFAVVGDVAVEEAASASAAR